MQLKLDNVQKKEIGDQIRQCLIENQLARRNGGDNNLIISPQQLADKIGVVPATIYKLHSGDFSIKTLRLVEASLGRKFTQSLTSNLAVKTSSERGGAIGKEHWKGAMPVRFGGYSREAIEPYLGKFVAVSRGVSVSTNFLGSEFEIFWDDALGAARFEESKRFTATDGRIHDYSQSGTLHSSLEIKTVHLLTARAGAIRLITLTGIHRDPELVMYGAVLTQVPESGQYVPSKSTVHFRKITNENTDYCNSLLGPITPDHLQYEKVMQDLNDADKAIYTR